MNPNLASLEVKLSHFDTHIDGIWGGTLYTTPSHTIEKDNKKILLYKAAGLSEASTTVEEEFINKTRDFYININGKYENDYLNWHNNVSIQIKVDTSIYSSYSVYFVDGLIIIELIEIQNEKPDIKRV